MEQLIQKARSGDDRAEDLLFSHLALGGAMLLAAWCLLFDLTHDQLLWQWMAHFWT